MLNEVLLTTLLTTFQQASLVAESIAPPLDLDPRLVLAIIQVESSFNPKAVGKDKERGLMQLHPHFHGNAPMDIKGNMEVGVRYLAKLKKACGYYKEAWFVCYNRGPNRSRLLRPTKFIYYVKVMKIYKRLKIPTYLAADKL